MDMFTFDGVTIFITQHFFPPDTAISNGVYFDITCTFCKKEIACNAAPDFDVLFISMPCRHISLMH